MRSITTSIILAAAVVASPAVAKPKSERPAATHSATQQKAPAIEKRALRALLEMSAFLRKQPNFTVRATTETDYVLDDGQKVTLSSNDTVRVEKPSRMRANFVSDRKERQFFYDGKTFTMYSPKLGFYTQVPAPPTVRELVDTVHDTYGIQLPLVDLFRWGSPSASFQDITAARFVGTTELDGVKVDQYAFRQPGLDWQIWIQRGEQPLPRKLLLTTTDDPARPEHSMTMAWELGTRYDDSMYTFTPPAHATQIAIEELPQRTATTTRQARRGPRR